MTFLRRGPWKARSPWKGRGPWCAKSPWGVADIPWTLDATAAAIREAISNADAWGTTGAVTGWRLPGHGGVRLSADAMTGPRLEQQQDGGFRWAAHNLHTSSEPSSAFTAGGTTPPTVGTGTLNGKTAPTITFDQTMGTGFGGSRALQTGSVGFTFAAGASYSQQQRVKLSRLLTGGEAVTIYSTGDQGFSQSTINASNSDQYVGINGGLLVNSLMAASGGGVSKPYIFLAGAMQSSLTVTMTEFQANVGALTAYVPTAGAARYAPAVPWDAALGVWGLRSEPAATNLLTWSNAFDDAAWLKARCTVSANTRAAPDGTTTADDLVEDTTNNSHPVYRTVGSLANATAYTFSCFVLPLGRTRVQLIVSAAAFSAVPSATYLLTGGGSVTATSNGATARITQFGAWYRIEWTATTGAAGNGEFYIEPLNDAGSVGYLGNGAAALSMWGAQIETGSRATSPIPTFAATVTRTADSPLVPGLPAMTEGVVVVDYVLPSVAAGVSRVLASLSDGSTSNYIAAFTRSTDSQVTAEATLAGVTDRYLTDDVPVAGVRGRVAAGFKAGDFAFSHNGRAPQTTSAGGAVPVVTQLDFGHLAGAVQGGVLVPRIRLATRKPPNDRIRSLSL